MQAVTILSLFANNIENGIDQLGAFSVVTFRPVVSGAGLPEHEVIGTEDLAIGSGSDAVHGARLQIHEDRPGNEPSAGGLVVVDVDALELEVGGGGVGAVVVFAGAIDAVLVADDFPELGADLVAALASLNVKNLSHGGFLGRRRREW